MNDVPLYYKNINFNCSFENSKGVNYIYPTIYNLFNYKFIK